jgi:serine/threonine protein kinase/tetratricopeptide (TPR) repeat protein
VACPGEAEIEQYARGLLAAQAVAALNAHLRDCSSCQDLLERQLEPPAPETLQPDEMPTWKASRERSANADNVTPGTMIDHFRVIGLLGKGGMGEVYLARDTKLGRKVALKVIKEKAPSEEAKQRFLNEARLTARFSHPNIVLVHAVGEWSGVPYVALEYLEGKSLRELMVKGRISLQDILHIGRSIADALVEAHSHGVLHRDLKPGNVLVPDDGRVRVVDFGLATFALSQSIAIERALGAETMELVLDLASAGTDLRGTAEYMSPERWTRGAVGPPIDVWALGIVLYELVAGFRPYRGEGRLLAQLVQHVTSPEPVPRFSPDTPVIPELASLIYRCLEKEPARRPTAAQVSQELAAMTHGAIAGLPAGDGTLPRWRDDAPSSKSGPEVGQVLGDRFELVRELGRGAHGVVFEARDRVAEETVAIKILSAEAGESDLVKRIQRELKAARKIAHPGVVRLHDLVQVGSHLALSMEYIEGETLQARLLRSERLAPEELVSLGRDLAAALSAAWEAGVVHRDVKPANIILRAGSGRAVITDFGISRITHAIDDYRREQAGRTQDVNLTREGEIVGTPLYMSPEQFLGKSDVGPEADVYALGVVLFEAAMGYAPHSASSLVELRDKRVGEPAPPLDREDLSSSFQRVVERCLARDPAERFPTAKDVLAALAPTPRRSTLYPFAGAAIVLAIVLAAIWWISPLPMGERRVAIEVELIGDEPAPILADAAKRLLYRALNGDRRGFELREDRRESNVVAHAIVRLRTDKILLDLDLEPRFGRARRLARVQADSIAAAVASAAPRLAAELAREGAEPSADRWESERMTELGIDSIDAYRAYSSALDTYLGSVVFDVSETERSIKEALEQRPGWAHAHALLATVQGRVSEDARRSLEKAESSLARGTDPTGEQILVALRKLDEGKAGEAAAILTPLFQRAPDDVLLGWVLSIALVFEQRTAEMLAVLGRMHELRPDLQFGADVIGALHDQGRSDEVGTIAKRWIERAPESEQALAAWIGESLAKGDKEAARRLAEGHLLLHGVAPHRLVTLADLFLDAGLPDEARTFADRLVGGTDVDRARGLYRRGLIALMEGRFGAACDALEQATELGARLGSADFEGAQAAEALRSCAEAFDKKEDAVRSTRALLAIFELQRRAPPIVAALENELRLLESAPASCPPLRSLIAAIPEGPARSLAERDTIRAAGHFGCAPCEEAVRAGSSLHEQSTRSLFYLGECAERTGALDLARDVFSRATKLRLTTDGFLSSPYLSILARHHLARVLERLGDHEGAKSAYRSFVERWAHPDRPVRELDEARGALARLH